MSLQVRVQNLTKERDMLRQAESRLSREKEAMLAEQRNQNLLLTNIKSIQVPERTIVLFIVLFFLLQFVFFSHQLMFIKS